MKRNCPFCGSDWKELSSVKARQKFFKVLCDDIMECGQCGSFYAHEIDPDGLAELYRKSYPKQPNGLRRFRANFPNVGHLDGNVLEIGGGQEGVRKIVSGVYHNVDLGSGATLNAAFDFLTDDQLNDLSAQGISTVVTCDCIEHMIDPRQAFINMHRILQPEGTIHVQIGEFHDENAEPTMQSPHISRPSKRGIDAALKGLFIIKEWTTNSSFTAVKT